MKKLVALVLALALCLSLCSVALATPAPEEPSSCNVNILHAIGTYWIARTIIERAKEIKVETVNLSDFLKWALPVGVAAVGTAATVGIIYALLKGNCDKAKEYTYANGLYSVCNLLNPTEEKAIGVRWQKINAEYPIYEDCSTKEKIAKKEKQGDLLCITYCGVGEKMLSDYIDALKQKLGEEKVVKNEFAGLYQITYNEAIFIAKMIGYDGDLLIVFDPTIFDS